MLLKTLFSPWWRIREEYQKGAGMEKFFASLIVNSIMRIVGFCIRIVTIIIGLAVLLVCFFGGIIFYMIWLLLPLLLLVLLLYSIKSITA
jgi:hypothetical protein